MNQIMDFNTWLYILCSQCLKTGTHGRHHQCWVSSLVMLCQASTAESSLPACFAVVLPSGSAMQLSLIPDMLLTWLLQNFRLICLKKHFRIHIMNKNNNFLGSQSIVVVKLTDGLGVFKCSKLDVHPLLCVLWLKIDSWSHVSMRAIVAVCCWSFWDMFLADGLSSWIQGLGWWGCVGSLSVNVGLMCSLGVCCGRSLCC